MVCQKSQGKNLVFQERKGIRRVIVSQQSLSVALFPSLSIPLVRYTHTCLYKFMCTHICMNRKAYKIEKQVAPVPCQATTWLTTFGFHVLCLGKTKSVLTGFSNSHVPLMGSITTDKSQTQSGPLLYLKTWSSTWTLCCPHAEMHANWSLGNTLPW